MKSELFLFYPPIRCALIYIFQTKTHPPSSGFIWPIIRDLGIGRVFLLKFCSLRLEPHIWFRLFYNEVKKYEYTELLTCCRPSLDPWHVSRESFWNHSIKKWSDIKSPFIFNYNIICFIAILDVFGTKKNYQKCTKNLGIPPPLI